MEKVKNIPVFKPLLRNNCEIRSAIKSLKEGWLGMGSYVETFEQKIQNIIQNTNKAVVAVNTGFSAIHLACILLNLKKGDEVIIPSHNNIADFQCLILEGLKPVMCDVEKNTLCADPKSIKKLITKKTKAIIIIDYASNIANHDEIKKIAKYFNIKIIHDASHSLGSFYKGKPIGSFSEITTFSFDPVKTFTCIDGGAIIVNKGKNVKKLQEMRIMGMKQNTKILYKNSRSWTYDVKSIGYRYHLANVHAAIGIQQLNGIKVIRKTRIATYNYYYNNLKNIPQIFIPKLQKGVLPFICYILVKKNLRDRMIKFLKKKGIDTGIHWKPNHLHTLIKKNKCRHDLLTNTNQMYRELLTLPFHSCMKKSHEKKVVKVIKDFFLHGI